MGGRGAGMLFGESGFSLSSPFKSQREERGEGVGDRPWRGPIPQARQSPTLLGLLLGPGQGESKCVAVDLFSILLFVLYGDAFLVFYTIRKDKVLEILMSFV